MKKFLILITIITSFVSLSASKPEETDSDTVEISKYRALQFRLSQLEGSEQFYKTQASRMEESLKSTGNILIGLQSKYDALLAEKESVTVQNNTLLEEKSTWEEERKTQYIKLTEHRKQLKDQKNFLVTPRKTTPDTNNTPVARTTPTGNTENKECCVIL